MRMRLTLGAAISVVLIAAMLGLGRERTDDAAEINAVVDGFHAAAAAADFDAYFGLMSDEMVFIGTDASERWDRAAFEAFCKPYFDEGKGWAYSPRDRHVMVRGDVAWIDELLDNEKYGELWGTAVLVREDGAWKVTHYCLNFAVPNDVSRDVVGRIAEWKAGRDG